MSNFVLFQNGGEYISEKTSRNNCFIISVIQLYLSIEDLMNFIYAASEEASKQEHPKYVKAICDLFLRAKDYDLNSKDQCPLNMDWLRKELSDNYSNTFQYNQQGDPESVFVLFNRVLRKIMGADTAALESVKLENGSIDTTSQNITDSSILSKLAKITKPRKIGCKRLSQLYGVSLLVRTRSLKSNLKRPGEEEDATNAIIDDYFSYDYLHSTFEVDGVEKVK